MEKINVLAITQARIGSSRLPKKVLLPIGNDTLLGLHLKRMSLSKSVDRLIVATTEETESDSIVDIAKENNVLSYKGSLTDVLDRFYQAAKLHQPNWVVRVTSDCPLIDAALVDEVICEAIKGNYDYYANILTEDFPDGQDIEVFKFSVLERAWNAAKLLSEREHVTPYIRKNSSFNGGHLFQSGDYKAPENFNHVRMTVDEPVDLRAMNWIVSQLGTNESWLTYTNFMIENAAKIENSHVIRNEGYLKSIRNENN
ncbi:MAG: cytidylyltransferase domain-containing protein [Salibacteraceae bacterium]